jgi:hypothetical protein
MTVTDPAALDARYGRTPKKKRRDRWIYIVGGIVVAVVVSAWVLWAGLDQASGTLDAEDVGSTIIDARTVQVNYQLSMPVGETAACALQVENAAHAITGWKIVKIPASTKLTHGYSTIVKSSEKPTTGLIYQCWLT